MSRLSRLRHSAAQRPSRLPDSISGPGATDAAFTTFAVGEAGGWVSSPLWDSSRYSSHKEEPPLQRHPFPPCLYATPGCPCIAGRLEYPSSPFSYLPPRRVSFPEMTPRMAPTKLSCLRIPTCRPNYPSMPFSTRACRMSASRNTITPSTSTDVAPVKSPVSR